MTISNGTPDTRGKLATRFPWKSSQAIDAIQSLARDATVVRNYEELRRHEGSSRMMHWYMRADGDGQSISGKRC